MKIGDAGYINLMKKPSFEEPKTTEEKKLKEVSQQFESIFVKMLIDSMDKTVDRKSSMFYGGQGEEVFRNMLNDEKAKDISKGAGIGLAKSIYEQLSKHVNEEKK